MNIIIPMAGMGKRMRPHTFNIPKPMLKISGKFLVQRIVEELKESSGKKIDEIHYIIGDFGREVENKLIEIAKNVGAIGYIHYQKEALGTAHAVFCAGDALKGEILIAFADTLFVGNFQIEDNDEAIIWTMKVTNPEQYGVVLKDLNNKVVDFVEKSKTFVSDQAIIGIYYFRNGEFLKGDIKRLIENGLLKNGEFQLTDNLLFLLKSGVDFSCKEILEWLDCGNKDEFLKSNRRIPDLKKYKAHGYKAENSEISELAFIGRNVEIINSKIGSYVSIEDNTKIVNSTLSNTIISYDCVIKNSEMIDSMVGNNCVISNCKGKVNVGDNCEYEGI